MKKENFWIKLFQFLKNIWSYKKFHYSNLGYALLSSLFLIYFIGAVHYDSIESDLKIEETQYSNSLKEEIHQIINRAIRREDFKNLDKDFDPFRNKLMIMVQDYYNFKIYYDSHENYKFIRAKKGLDFFTVLEVNTKYEVSIYSIEKQRWNSVYKHWLKYFSRSFRENSKYRYLTIWLFLIYSISVFILTLFSREKESADNS